MSKLPADSPEDLKQWSDAPTLVRELGRRAYYAMIGENRGNDASKRHTIWARCIETQHRNGTFKTTWVYKPEDNAPATGERYKTTIWKTKPKTGTNE